MQVTINFEFDDQLVDDIITTCFEGGSTYWIDDQEVKDGDYKGAEFASEVVSKGGTLILYVEGTKYELTLEKFIKGMELALNDKPNLLLAFQENDGDWDAGDADYVLQFALFGELVYG